MATNFPNSPSNGATHTFGGTTYTYSTSVGAWTAPSSGRRRCLCNCIRNCSF